MHPLHAGEVMLRTGTLGQDERAVHIELSSYQHNDLRDGLAMLKSAEFQPSRDSGQTTYLFVRGSFPS